MGAHSGADMPAREARQPFTGMAGCG